MLAPQYLALALLLVPSIANGDQSAQVALNTNVDIDPVKPASHPEVSDYPPEPYPRARFGATIPLKPDAYEPAPSSLALRQVQIFVRHGERTPNYASYFSQEAGVRPSDEWARCGTLHLCKLVSSELEESVWTCGKPGEPGKPEEPGKPGELVKACKHGSLTDTGRKSTHSFGEALRELYITKLGFLPDKPGKGEAYFRSVDTERVVESLYNIRDGLYPPESSNENVPKLLVRKSEVDNLRPRKGCNKLDRLVDESRKILIKEQGSNHTPKDELRRLDKKIDQYISKPFDVSSVGGWKLRAFDILDEVLAADSNEIVVPDLFLRKEAIDILETAAVKDFFTPYDHPEVCKLGTGPLLADLSQRLQDKVNDNQDPLKLLVYATHDTAIGSLLKALHVFDNKWPAFTASVTFELFGFSETQNTSPEKSHFVRIRYQNRTLKLPFCKEEDKHFKIGNDDHPELCTLDAFLELLKPFESVNTYDKWKSECDKLDVEN